MWNDCEGTGEKGKNFRMGKGGNLYDDLGGKPWASEDINRQTQQWRKERTISDSIQDVERGISGEKSPTRNAGRIKKDPF